MLKRLLAMVLVLALTLSNLPVAALAAELNELTAEETVEETVVETTEEETIEEEIPEEIEEISEEIEEISEETEEITGEAESAGAPVVTSDDGLYSPAFTFHSDYPVSNFNKITEFEADPDEENVFYLRYYPDPWVDSGAWAETAPGTFVVNHSEACTWELMFQDQYESVYKITLNELGNDWVSGKGIGEVWNFIVFHDGIVHWQQNGTWMQEQFNGAGILYITNKDATETIVTPPIPIVPGDSDHPAYMSYSWLYNNGYGWAEDEYSDGGESYNIMPGISHAHIYYVNTWDASLGQYVKTPVYPMWDGDLEIVNMARSEIGPDEPNQDYFVWVRNHDTWDQAIPIYYILDDGTRVDHVTAYTFREELCIYDSPVMSNESCVIGNYMYDLSKGGDNELYVGFDNDYWTNVSFAVEYGNLVLQDTSNPKVKRIYLGGDAEWGLKQGYDQYFAIRVDGMNGGYQNTAYINFGVTPDPDTIPHDPYLSYGWLDNWGDGFFVNENPEHTYFEQMPGVQNSYVFVLNTWDDAKQAYVQSPVIPENDYGLIIEPMDDEMIAPDQSLSAGFANVYNPGIWDTEIPLYVTLEDGTKVGGMTVNTIRAEVCLYNSPDLSNETYISELMVDYNSDDNHFYIGLDSDWVTPLGEPFVYDDYAGYLTFEKVTDTVYKVNITREYLDQISHQGGEDWYGGFGWEVQNVYGDTWVNGIPYGLHIYLDPDTMPHEPYLTYGWLDNWGEGWFDSGEWHENEGFNICPGDQFSVIFFLNLWDEEQGCFVANPVPVSKLKSNGLIFTTLKDAMEGQENTNCFAGVTAKESAFRKDVVVYVEHEGEKIGWPVSVDLHRLAFYSSADIGYKTYLMDPLEIDPFGENVVYLGFNDGDGEWTIKDLSLVEGCEDLAAIEQVKNNVWKVTASKKAIDRMANQYLMGIGIWAEFQNTHDEGWTDYEENWFTLSRMELETKAAFELDYALYEIIEGGYARSFPTGEYDEWGEIWDGEFVTELPEGLSYNLKTNTLTLDNYHGEAISFYYRGYDWETGEEWFNLPSDTLTIKLIGENSLISDRGTAADFNGQLNVKFVGDGSLYLKSTNNPDQIDWEGHAYNYSTLWINEGSLTLEDSVKVTAEIAGSAMESCWNENGYVGNRPAHLVALSTDRTNIYIKENATLTTLVPEGAKRNGPTLPENHEYVFWDDRNPGGFSGIEGFSKLHVSGGTLNTSGLYLRDGYWDYEGDYFGGNNAFHSTSFILSGGTVNIDALGSYCTMENWQWNEETQQEEFVGSYEGLHYAGLDTGLGSLIDISGGTLNIDVDPSEHPDEIRANFTGMNLMGTDLLLSGGEINFIPGYEGCMMQLQAVDYNEEIYFTSVIAMTGGNLNLNGKDDCRVIAMDVDPRSLANFTGGTIVADNADFCMGGEVVFDGTELTGIHLDYFSDGYLKFNSGLLSLHEESSIMMGQAEMNGGSWDLSKAGVYVHGGFHFNDGEIIIVNEGENIFWPGLIVQTYFAMNGDAKLNLKQNGIAPALEVRGTFHQMDDSVVTIEHRSSVGEAAVFVPDGSEGEYGTMLLNDGKFLVSSLGAEPIVGLRTDRHSLLQLGEGEMVLNNATVEMGGYMEIQGADFRMNANLENKNEDEWYIAFLGGVGSDLTVQGGTMTIETRGYDCAFDLCGNYQQKHGKVYVDSDQMAMAIKGVAVIEDGELNLRGVSGYTQNYEPEITTDSRLHMFGGVMNIEAVELGMELAGRTEIAGGQLNINVSGNEIITENSGAILLGRGILLYSSGMEASLVISGGEHSITVPIDAAGYLDSGLQAILAVDSKVEFLGGTLRTNSFHGIMSDTTREDLQFHLGHGMTAYDLDSGKEMIPVDHIFYADENYQPVSPESAVYIEYIRIFDKDNNPDGDIFTEEGIQWAGNLLICEDNRVIESLETDADQLLPGKKATLTAEVSDPAVKLTWSLAEGDKNYATLKVGKNNTATVTAKKNKEIQQVTVTVSTVIDGRTESKFVTIEIVPVVSQVDILGPDQSVLTGKTVTFYMEEQVEYNVLPLDAACAPAEALQEVTWKSSNTKYATVDADGIVTVLTPGKTVTITATAADGSGKKATFKIKTAIAVESIELSGSDVCAVGKTIALKANVLPENATNKKLEWYIVDGDALVTKNDIASISSSGKLKGLAAGEVTVRAAWEDWQDVYAEWTVSIMPAVKQVDILDGFENVITKETVELWMSTTGDNTLQLNAVNAPEGSAQAVTWKSSNTKYATVDENGLVTAIQAGKTVTITATAADGSGKSAKVTIKTVQPMEAVTLSGSSVAAAGKTISLSAQIYPENTTNKKLNWYIVDGDALVAKNDLASISSSGKLKVGKEIEDGETITVRAAWAENGSVYDEWTVTLYATAAYKVVITDAEGNKPEATLTMATDSDNTIDLYAQVQAKNPDKEAEPAQDVTWKSSNEKYATVDENGTVTILVPDKSVTITATASDGSGKKATVKIKGVQPMEALTLQEDLLLDDNGNLFIAGGKSLKLATALEIFPANTSNKKLSWSVEENEYGIKVSSSGVLSTKKVEQPVTVEVTAVAKDEFGAEISFDVTVYPATSKNVTILYEEEAVKELKAVPGEVLELSARNDTAYSAELYTWKSSNTKYATVDAAGVVTLLDAAGKTVTITATAADGSGQKATVKIKIVAEAE